jgi:hypothetical protein
MGMTPTFTVVRSPPPPAAEELAAPPPPVSLLTSPEPQAETRPIEAETNRTAAAALRAMGLLFLH